MQAGKTDTQGRVAGPTPTPLPLTVVRILDTTPGRPGSYIRALSPVLARGPDGPPNMVEREGQRESVGGQASWYNHSVSLSVIGDSNIAVSTGNVTHVGQWPWHRADPVGGK